MYKSSSSAHWGLRCVYVQERASDVSTDQVCVATEQHKFDGAAATLRLSYYCLVRGHLLATSAWTFSRSYY